MKTLNNILKIAVPILAFGLNANAQKDGCGVVKDLKNNQITVPYLKDGVCIQFFYHDKWITQAVYNNWNELVSDFPSSSKDSALIKFDWNKLSQLRKGNNGWDAVVQNSKGKTYVGFYFDMTQNYDVEKIKIVNIESSCFYPACSPDTYVFYIGVSLAEK